MGDVKSKDGTEIAFDRTGDGPGLVIVAGGTLRPRSERPLAEALAPDFTVFNYDRRGRGAAATSDPTPSNTRSRTFRR
jgi:hypothetical protein